MDILRCSSRCPCGQAGRVYSFQDPTNRFPLCRSASVARLERDIIYTLPLADLPFADTDIPITRSSACSETGEQGMFTRPWKCCGEISRNTPWHPQTRANQLRHCQSRRFFRTLICSESPTLGNGTSNRGFSSHKQTVDMYKYTFFSATFSFLPIISSKVHTQFSAPNATTTALRWYRIW